MDEKRKQILATKSKEELLNLDRTCFTFTECQDIINETRLTKLDKAIAQLKVMDCMTFEEIASKVFVDKRTVERHWLDISQRLKETVVKLYYKGNDLF